MFETNSEDILKFSIGSYLYMEFGNPPSRCIFRVKRYFTSAVGQLCCEGVGINAKNEKTTKFGLSDNQVRLAKPQEIRLMKDILF